MTYDPMKLLAKNLSERDRLEQAEAARLLGDVGSPQAIPALLDYVRHCRWHAKSAGFHALAEIGEPEVCASIRPLVDLPNCPDDFYWYGRKSVRAAAAVALLRLGDDGGVGCLEELAAEDSPVFFAWYAPAILRLPPATAADALKERLSVPYYFPPETGRLRTTDAGEATMIAEALGEMGSPEASGRLLELTEHQSRYVRAQAATSLASVSDEKDHIDRVEEMARTDPADFTKIQAAHAMGRTDREEHLDVVRSGVEDCQDPFDRATAVRALGDIGNRQDFSRISRRLEDPEPYVRQRTVEALEKIDGERAETFLGPLRGDGSVRVRMQVAKFYAVHQEGQ